MSQKEVCILPFIHFDQEIKFGPLEILNLETNAEKIKSYDENIYSQTCDLRKIFRVGYTKDYEHLSVAILDQSFSLESHAAKRNIQTGIKLLGYFFSSKKGRYNSTFIDHFDYHLFTLPEDPNNNDSINFRSRYMSMNVVEIDKVIIADPYYATFQNHNNTHLSKDDKKFLALEKLYIDFTKDKLDNQEILLAIEWMNHSLKANPNITKEMYLLFAFTALETLLDVGRPNKNEGKANAIYKSIQKLFNNKDPVEIDGLYIFLKDLCNKRNDIIHDGKILEEFNYAQNNNYFDICSTIFHICLYQRLYQLDYFEGDVRNEHDGFLKYELEKATKNIDNDSL